ncbi:MAG: hypothetical protein HRT88_14440 [Lentisphaeraceae bacterium]|nr:hypothetical protein [Lentisphaeraceae bacterium]
MMNLSIFQRDALCEVANVGVGSAAELISNMTGEAVEIYIPELSVVSFSSITEYLNGGFNGWDSCVMMSFNGEFSGDMCMVFDHQGSSFWAKVFAMDDPQNPVFASDVLLEVGNIIINSCIGSAANWLAIVLDPDLPVYCSQQSGLSRSVAMNSGAQEKAGVNLKLKIKFGTHSCNSNLLIFLDMKNVESFTNCLERAFDGTNINH